MGEVWLAQRDDALLTRAVAVKLPLLQTTSAALRLRFEREREILAALTHPNIARLYDAGISADGQPYMALEYVQGQSLMRHADAHRLTIDQRVELFLQVADAVQHAHTQLVIHRDLKPSNILVTEDGQVRLLDFGIAKLLQDGQQVAGEPQSLGASSALTREVGHAMSLDYASPEQVQLQPVGTLSDVYSLGLLLYELLAGQRPYKLQRGTRAELEALILAGDQPPPSARLVPEAAVAQQTTPRKLVQALKGDLDTIVLKAVKVQPGDRYASVAALADDLRRWQTGLPVLAQPDSARYRSWRFVQRHRWAVAGAVAVVGSLAVGLGVALWQAQVAREEARIAKATEAFLKGLFDANSVRQAHPELSQPLSARDLLDRGAERIATELGDAPEVRLRMLATLADLYTDLLVTEPAVRLRQELMRLRQQLHPGPTRAHANDLIDLAGTANMVLSRSETAGYLKQARDILDGLGDRSSALRGHLEVAQAQQVMADRRLGAQYAARGVEILRPLGPTESLADALVTLAVCQAELDDPAQAVTTAQEALRLVDSLHLEAERPTLYGVMAAALSRLGQLDASIESARAGVAAAARGRAAQAPPNSAELALAMMLAGLLAQSAQPQQARAALDAVLQRALRTEADLDRYALRGRAARALSLRGKILIDSGEPEVGLRDLQHAEQLMAKTPVSDGQKSQFLDRLASALVAQGRLGEAQCQLDESRLLHQRLQHAGSVQINEHVVAQVRLLTAAGRGDQAQVALAAFQADAPFGGQRSRSAIEHDVLAAEANAVQRRWLEAQRRAQALADEMAARPQPQYVADLRARAAAVGRVAATGRSAGLAARPAAVRAPGGMSCNFDSARWLELAPKPVLPGR
jgi:serine/threonine-protein kinase